MDEEVHNQTRTITFKNNGHKKTNNRNKRKEKKATFRQERSCHTIT